MVRRRLYRTRKRRVDRKSPNDLLNARDMCLLFRISRLRLARLMVDGEIPLPTEFTKGVPFWWYKDVAAARAKLEVPMMLPAHMRSSGAP